MLIKSFLDYLRYERNYSEKTVLAYSEDIKQLQEFAQEEYGKFDPLEVEGELIREWIVSLMDRGYTSTSVNRKLSSLRSFYKYLLRQGEVTKDPLCKITGPKNKKPLPVFLKESEMNKLLDETDFGEGFKGYRDRLIIEVFYATGIRLSELIGLDDKDVDFSASLLKVTGKRNKQRFQKSGKLNIVVFILFLIPAMPKDVFTYLVPLTDMRMRTFLILATIGRIPGVMVSTYAAAGLAEGQITTSLIIFGVAAAIALLCLIFRNRIMRVVGTVKAFHERDKENEDSRD